MILSVRQRVNHEIGWHRHPDHSWIWGVRPNDGCALCDLAERWILAQRDWRNEVAASIRERRAIWSEPVIVEKKKEVKVEVIVEERAPVVIVPQNEPRQLAITDTNAVTLSPDNDEEEAVPVPVAPPEPVFRLTNPDAHSITRGGRRRKR